MPFVKVQKNNAYFSRFQVKYRRRREGKNDYYARQRLVNQAKNKHAAPKYRLIVRITNKKVICQVAYSKIQGDFIIAQATSAELPRYGIKHGLTNWAACYATGLLLGRRLLTKLGLADKYEGVVEATGEYSVTEELGGGHAKPFKCFLDVGLKRTTTGARIFGCLKGASDAGLYIPHSEKRFPGYDIETKSLDSEVLARYIVGGHIAEFMEELREDDETALQRRFSSYLADDLGPEDLEEIYTSAHAAIREDPTFKASDKSKNWKEESLKYRTKKLTHAERKERVQQKLTELRA